MEGLRNLDGTVVLGSIGFDFVAAIGIIAMRAFTRIAVLISVVLAPHLTLASPSLEQQLSQLFVGRSFTIRNFYRGRRLHYGSDGQLLEKAEPGFWSRDGMVQFSAVKLSADGILIMQGNRYCVQFEPEQVSLLTSEPATKWNLIFISSPIQLTLSLLIPVLQKVLLGSRDKLDELVPAYWKNCLARQVTRKDKHSLWECVPGDRSNVPEFSSKDAVWDLPPADTSLHTGRRRYLLQHRVAYLSQPGLQAPTFLGGADPFFDWLQERISIGEMTMVLSLTIGEDGKPRDLVIVSPMGMGVDDEAAQAVSAWKFKPGTREGRPCAVPARVFFDVRPTSGRPY